MEGRGISLLTLLLASAIVLTFAALNVRTYAFAGSPPPPRSTPSENLERVVIRVEGMSCATCEIAIRYALKSVNGVESVRVSAAAKTATVDYDPTKTNPEKLVAAINSTGYRATLPATSPRSRAGAALPREKPESIGETAQHQPSEERISMDRVSLFKVSLECPAAPQIGCGTASKPILLQLEQEPGVAEAWLNRAGTQIAVVWKPEADAGARRNVAAKLTDDAKEMQVEPSDEALKGFLSGKGWYRGAEVDRLSEEEAGIIAARLIRRLEAKTPVSKEKAEALQHALTESWSECVKSGKHVATNGGQPACRFEDIAENIASKYLNSEQLKIFEEAVQEGVIPLPNES